MSPSITRSPFGTLPDGAVVEAYDLRAGTLAMRVITFGGTIVSLHAPDRDGRVDDIVLGFDALEDYATRSPYFGAIVGRCGNRIAEGRFTLDVRSYQLATNDGPHHLHGGDVGFDKVVWDATPIEREGEVGIRLARTSPDGEEGYPGALATTVRYLLDDAGRLTIDYEATTDRATLVNLTQHSYFDLSAGRAPDIGGHELTIRAERITPVREGLIPTGELRSVAGTPFDFRTPVAIGARVNDASEQLRLAGGYDHNFVLDAGGDGPHPAHAARVVEPVSGRTLDVYTTEPGLQFYSGNFLDGSLRGKGGRVYGHRAGFCLETQHFPNSPNVPAFPPVVLRPGETYRSRSVYVMGTDR